MAKWQIGRRVAACGTCEVEFKDGDALYSLLKTGEEGLERADLCVACYSDEAVADALFWWRTHHQVEEQRGLKLDLEAIEALFVALDQKEVEGDVKSAGSQRLLELRYLLCLILLRKRRLKVTKVARSHNGVEGEFFIVKRPRRDEQLAVAVFDFDGDKIASLRDDLQRIFEGADPAELAGEEAPVTAVVGEEASESADANEDSETAEPIKPETAEEVPVEGPATE